MTQAPMRPVGHRDAERPELSVIVPHYDDLQGLDRCLEALATQTFSGGFEIIVADNGSPQGAAAIEAVVGARARLAVVPEKGAGPARNGGAAAARGAVLAFTDSDCVPDARWLEAGLAALSDCDFVGGAMRVLVEQPDRMTPVEAFETVFAFDNQSYVERKGFTVTANLFCPREVFDQVGGFRVGVSEDLDWSHRAREAGLMIGYAPGAVVGHPARRTWRELRDKWRRLSAETYGLYRTRRAGRPIWLIRSLALPLSALAHTGKVLTSRRLSSWAQRAGALVTLYRLRWWRMADALRLLAADLRRGGGWR